MKQQSINLLVRCISILSIALVVIISFGQGCSSGAFNTSGLSASIKNENSVPGGTNPSTDDIAQMKSNWKSVSGLYASALPAINSTLTDINQIPSSVSELESSGNNSDLLSVLKDSRVKGILIRSDWKTPEPAETGLSASQIKGFGIEQNGDQQFNWAYVDKVRTLVESADKDWSLAIFGQPVPSWLAAKFNASTEPFMTFNFQALYPRSFPMMWYPEYLKQIKELGIEIKRKYGGSRLRLVYLPQATANGVEGHFNGVPYSEFQKVGFTPERFSGGVLSALKDFAEGLGNIPVGVELHKVYDGVSTSCTNMESCTSNKSAELIMAGIQADERLKNQVGIAMWWISGRTDYQYDLALEFKDYTGYKLAQAIANSSQEGICKDGTLPSSCTATTCTCAGNISISKNRWPSVNWNTSGNMQQQLTSYVSGFEQNMTHAQDLGIRYYEAWEYEFLSDNRAAKTPAPTVYEQARDNSVDRSLTDFLNFTKQFE